MDIDSLDSDSLQASVSSIALDDPHPIDSSNPPVTYTHKFFAIYNQISPSVFDTVVKQLEDLHDGTPEKCDFGLRGSREFINEDLGAIVEYHRSISLEGIYDPLLFIVVDNENWQEKGVLLVNLDVYDDCDGDVHDQHVEAVRQKVDNLPLLTLVGIDIANTDWFETLDNLAFGLQWDRYFAFYPNERSRETAYEHIEDDYFGWSWWVAFRRGLQGIKKQRYELNFFAGRDGTLEEVTYLHRSVTAQDEKLHPSLFIFYDHEDWLARKEVTLVNLDQTREDGSVATLKRPMREAGELLTSIDLGEREWPSQ